MTKPFLSRIALFLTSLCASAALAAPQAVRWTGQDDRNADLNHILDVIRAKTGIALSIGDLLEIENRGLAGSHFTMYVEVAGKVPVKNTSLRVWTSPVTGDAIQIEASVDALPSGEAMRALRANAALTQARTMEIVRSVVKAHLDDRTVGAVDWTDYWADGNLVRVVTVKSAHGKHTITISVTEGRLLSQRYDEYPQDGGPGTGPAAGELSIPVQIYPIYEEVEGDAGPGHHLLSRVPSELRYVLAKVPRTSEDPYGSLRQQRYPDDKQDPVLGLTLEGRKQGFWSMAYLKMLVADIFAKLPLTDNSFANGGVVLEGRYTTVNLHPKVPTAFKQIKIVPTLSPVFKPEYRPMPDRPDHDELIPSASLHGRPIASVEEAMGRPARRLPNHDPAEYINDGFDELQVYWAVNQMFDSLRPMGFTDPELSTRRFNAFLYDPDISYRDNAFYTDDTINFTTYSPKGQNMARDNTTIWHELGHGVMDRLMGDHIQLADTGGLSEGMADFVAQLVINDVTNGQPFEGRDKMRIFNKTGFNLTNEVHDDGEAYGGSMNDMLVAAMNRWGRAGLSKVTDLTLEAMRLTRNHPGLTANDWFNHMLFADSRGNSPVREPNELRELILTALAGRNFSLDGSTVASYSLKQAGQEVTSSAPGSRNNPIRLKLKPEETTTHHLEVSLKSTATYAFKYPVKVRVQFTGGPLQGAIHWTGKEQGAVNYTLNSEADLLKFDLTALGKCDEINRPDNSCVDYAYVQIWNAGETAKPAAKKRFYLRIYPQ